MLRARPPQNAEWVLATSDYGGEFVAAVQRGNVCATQFHPEKSGGAGLDIMRSFLDPDYAAAAAAAEPNGRLCAPGVLRVARHLRGAVQLRGAAVPG